MGKPSIHVNLNMKVDTVPQLMKALDALENRDVLVGIPEENTDRNDEDGEGPTNAMIGYVQNYGSAAQNIPATHFMENGIDDKRESINKRLERGAKLAMDGNVEAVEKSLIAAGLEAEVGIKRRITAGPPPPLKPRTLAARRRRGRTGTKRLNDTGQLRNAVTSVVRDRKRT